MAGVKKATIKAELSKKFKAGEDRIAVFGLKPKFGGGRSSGFATIYDDMDARKKYDTKSNLVKVGSSVISMTQPMHSRPRIPSSIGSLGREEMTVWQVGAFVSILSMQILNYIYFNRTKSMRRS